MASGARDDAVAGIADASPVPDVAIRIPPAAEFVGLVRHVVGATARLGGFSADFVDNAKLVASEACTNAVTMTSRAGRTDPVEVQADLEGDRLHIVIGDRGQFPVMQVPSSEDDPDSLDFSFDRGLSLPLIQGLVDDFQLSPRDGGGSVVRMTIVDAPPEEPETPERP
ncbi:MAG: ATP-binding protein [Actinomycetota bacterium]|nr:ATP-binding protein [Actinomycetota bacterium]